ncbi:MAG: S-methyl-5'-thioadenosine phosphorylase [Candidatus Hydrogenedentota bacterium]|nr:MAG: S-methyl-5'-thioadenosine phosphorylase [Candidatus Hydrogenedentota bacterium]
MGRKGGVIGFIGGSGVYDIEGIEDRREEFIETPYGPPSDRILLGVLEGRRVAFLPRHGRGHRILPHEVNSRANMWALKSVGVDWIVAFSAVGSLKEEVRPRDVVIPDQVFDRTKCRPSTFFGDGIAAHISFSEPYCPLLRKELVATCRELGLRVHDGGTYICIEGPSFSTKAESKVNRAHGFTVIGMTNLPEAKLAREAEIAYATVALATDYDVWHESEEDVSVELVLENLRANAENVKQIVRRIIPRIPEERVSPAHNALSSAIMTDRSLWPKDVVERLGVIIERYVQ